MVFKTKERLDKLEANYSEIASRIDARDVKINMLQKDLDRTQIVLKKAFKLIVESF